MKFRRIYCARHLAQRDAKDFTTTYAVRQADDTWKCRCCGRTVKVAW